MSPIVTTDDIFDDVMKATILLTFDMIVLENWHELHET